MQNSEGIYVDLYIQKNCQATYRLLDWKYTSSLQITLNTDRLNLENKKENQKIFIMVISRFKEPKEI